MGELKPQHRIIFGRRFEWYCPLLLAVEHVDGCGRGEGADDEVLRRLDDRRGILIWYERKLAGGVGPRHRYFVHHIRGDHACVYGLLSVTNEPFLVGYRPRILPITRAHHSKESVSTFL